MMRRIRRWLNETIKRKNVIPAYLIFVSAISLAFWQVDNLAEQRAQDVDLRAQRDTWALCVNEVNTREDFREMIFTLLQPFTDGGYPSEAVQPVIDIVDTLNENFPMLDREKHCGPEPRQIDDPGEGE